MATETPVRPFLRWAGSKRKLLPVLLQRTPSRFGRYVEPFAGSACLFFSLRPEKAILGDINSELIGTYLEVKYRVDSLIRHLRGFRVSKSQYYSLRAHRASKSTSAAAARFICLNRYCFNGLYRTNTSGAFNVPYGGKRGGEMPTSAMLKACSRLLRNAQLMAKPFEDVLDKVKRGDFVYLDPPFSVKAQRVFREYSAQQFADEDLIRLREYMLAFKKLGIRFLLSYADSGEADILKKGFKYEYVDVLRHISGFSVNRRVSREILIHN